MKTQIKMHVEAIQILGNIERLKKEMSNMIEQLPTIKEKVPDMARAVEKDIETTFECIDRQKTKYMEHIKSISNSIQND